MNGFCRTRRLLLASSAALGLMGSVAWAQQNKGVPNALQGFSENRGKPVQIEAGSLEVRDRDQVATFSGAVNVTQGDTNMKANSLVVFYERDEAGNGGTNMKAAKPGPDGAQQIKRLEAKGSVKVTQKDQVATGEQGIFDMRTNTVTLTGSVVVSKGKNVMRGERLVVNLETGVSTIDAGRSGGPVRMLIDTQDSGFKGMPTPGAAMPGAKPDQARGKTNAPKDTPKPSAAARQSPVY
jgi:lipopolysaccharide export system protein LptA